MFSISIFIFNDKKTEETNPECIQSFSTVKGIIQLGKIHSYSPFHSNKKTKYFCGQKFEISYKAIIEWVVKCTERG